MDGDGDGDIDGCSVGEVVGVHVIPAVQHDSLQRCEVQQSVFGSLPVTIAKHTSSEKSSCNPKHAAMEGISEGNRVVGAVNDGDIDGRFVGKLKAGVCVGKADGRSVGAYVKHETPALQQDFTHVVLPSEQHNPFSMITLHTC